MNLKCYDRDRRQLGPYVKYLWLLVKALEKLAPHPPDTVFRGVKKDLRNCYYEGREFTWHGPSAQMFKSVSCL